MVLNAPRLISYFLYFACHLFAAPTLFVTRPEENLNQRETKMLVAREGKRLTVTFTTEVLTAAKEFAWLIPLPSEVSAWATKLSDETLFSRLDEHSGPQLVETWDPDPCRDNSNGQLKTLPQKIHEYPTSSEKLMANAVYDFSVLKSPSSEFSAWLRKIGIEPKSLKVPTYYWMATRVRIDEPPAEQYKWLPPLQVVWQSSEFSVPIQTPASTQTIDEQKQENERMTLFFLSHSGRIQAKDFSSIGMPTGRTVPAFVKQKFREFYGALLSTLIDTHAENSFLLEYQGKLPLDPYEIGKTGVQSATPVRSDPIIVPFWSEPSHAVYLTRVQIVKGKNTELPLKLLFEETNDVTEKRPSYSIRHGWNGSIDCSTAPKYQTELRQSLSQSIKTLSELTQWSIPNIYEQMGSIGFDDESKEKGNKKWYDRINPR